MTIKQTIVRVDMRGLIFEEKDSIKKLSKTEKVKTVGVTNLVKGERKI